MSSEHLYLLVFICLMAVIFVAYCTNRRLRNDNMRLVVSNAALKATLEQANEELNWVTNERDALQLRLQQNRS